MEGMDRKRAKEPQNQEEMSLAPKGLKILVISVIVQYLWRWYFTLFNQITFNVLSFHSSATAEALPVCAATV